jgi:hypothetical protein
MADRCIHFEVCSETTSPPPDGPEDLGCDDCDFYESWILRPETHYALRCLRRWIEAVETKDKVEQRVNPTLQLWEAAKRWRAVKYPDLPEGE